MERLLGRVVLKKAKANPVRYGHPWIFSGAIDKIDEKNVEQGVEVYGAEGDFLGIGFYNERSQIRVRLLGFSYESGVMPGWGEEAVNDFIRKRVQDAMALRKKLNLPNAHTNAFRLLNGEGDGLPGVNVDLYRDVCVVQFNTRAMKEREQVFYQALKEVLDEFAVKNIIEVSGRFAELEGFSAKTRIVESETNFEKNGIWRQVDCLENGVSWKVQLQGGQKTGMFLDQRENRFKFATYCKGGKILDLYSHAGGFALQALKQGAAEAHCIDSSKNALAMAQENAAYNGLEKRLIVEEMDAFRYLEQVAPSSFDAVVVDPPSFAHHQKDVTSALKGYQRLNALALNAVKKGGIFASCVCSQLIEPVEFERVLARASRDSGRRVHVLDVASQAPDHPWPLTFTEGKYLQFILMTVY